MSPIIRPEKENTQWAIFSQADELNTSKGERKLRADLTQLCGKSKNLDRAHHLSVALADTKIREHRSDKPLEAGFRKIAVKIASGGEEGKDQYILLNINSLAKRLGVKKEDLKKHEKRGDVHTFIEAKLQDLAKDQQTVSRILSKIHDSINNVEPFKFSNAAHKEAFLDFIKHNFDDKKGLHRAAENFVNLEFTLDNQEAANRFIDHLKPQIWWNTDLSATAPEKIALTQENLGDASIIVSWGKTFERVGHPDEEARLINFIDWDANSENKYAIRVGDFLYSSKPKPHSSDEVPLKLSNEGVSPEKWVLVNVSDIEKKLGFTKKEIQESAQNNTLFNEVGKKLWTIENFHFPEAFIADFGFYDGDRGFRWDEETFPRELANIIQNHPNSEVKEIAESIHKEFNAFLETLPPKPPKLETEPPKPSEEEQIAEKERSFLIDERIAAASHALQQKLGAVGALRGFGHIENTYRGLSLTRPGMPGKAANRMKMFAWDTKQRYAPKLREETYFTKPKVASNEVALKRMRGGREEWLVFNKNSLKHRLGLSEAEIRPDGTSYLEEKIDAINHFNAQFSPSLERDDLTEKMYRTWLNAAIMQHPDVEVRAALQEAERDLTKLVKEWGTASEALPAFMHDKVNKLKLKLIEMGALSQEEAAEKNINMPPFEGCALTDDEMGSIFNHWLSTNGINAGAYIGPASKRPDHIGKDMPRLSFIEGDDAHRYTIAFEGRVYPNRPIARSTKEVAMALSDSHGIRGWVLINVHSLGRLGLSTKEVKKAAKNDTLFKEIQDRTAAIKHFNDDLQGLVRGDDTVDHYLKWLNINILHHPDKEIKTILKEKLHIIDSLLRKTANALYKSPRKREGDTVQSIYNLMADAPLKERHLPYIPVVIRTLRELVEQTRLA